MDSRVEEVASSCPECGKQVITYWRKDNTGCESHPDYVLVANWAFHSKCWDNMVDRGGPKTS